MNHNHNGAWLPLVAGLWYHRHSTVKHNGRFTRQRVLWLRFPPCDSGAADLNITTSRLPLLYSSVIQYEQYRAMEFIINRKDT